MQRALNGRQIERSNKAEVGADGTSQLRTLTLCGIRGELHLVPHLSPLQGEPFILRVPRVETLG